MIVKADGGRIGMETDIEQILDIISSLVVKMLFNSEKEDSEGEE